MCVNRWWRRPCREHYKTWQQRCFVPGSQREPAWQPWLLFHHLDTARLPSLHHSPSLTSFVCLFLPQSAAVKPFQCSQSHSYKHFNEKQRKCFYHLCKCFLILKSQPCIRQVTNKCGREYTTAWNLVEFIHFLAAIVKFYSECVMWIPTEWSESFSIIANGSQSF